MNYGSIAAAITLLIIGGGLYFYTSPEKPSEPENKKVAKPAQEIKGFGIIDIEKIQAAHPDGELLAQLQATELRLRLELNEAMRVVEMPKPEPPVVNEKVFDEAAWQKNAQEVISQLAELESRKKLAAEEYRQKSEAHYIEERNKIRDKYVNENFNIRLKLQNADNLRLKPEEIDELTKQLDKLEMERNAEQKALLDKWMAEIEKYAEESVAADEVRLKAESERLREEVEAQARQRESDVTERNKKLMEEALREMENRQIRRRELLSELNEIGKERSDLEQKILDSITDKATMLAAVHRLEMVFVRRKPVEEEKYLPQSIDWNFDLKSPERVGAVIYPGKTAEDLTEELIKEMNRAF